MKKAPAPSVAVIADAIRRHRLIDYWPSELDRLQKTRLKRECDCGWTSPERDCTWTDHPTHLAEMIDATLGGLTRESINKPEFRETGVMLPNPMIGDLDLIPERRLYFIPSVRWVSGWTPEERSEK